MANLVDLQSQLETGMDGTTLTLDLDDTANLPTTQALLGEMAGNELVLDNASITLDDPTNPQILTVTGDAASGTSVPLVSDTALVLASVTIQVSTPEGSYVEDFQASGALNPWDLSVSSQFGKTTGALTMTASVAAGSSLTAAVLLAALGAPDEINDIPSGLMPVFADVTVGYISPGPQQSTMILLAAVGPANAFVVTYSDISTSFLYGLAFDIDFHLGLSDNPLTGSSSSESEALTITGLEFFYNSADISSSTANSLNEQVQACLTFLNPQGPVASYSASGSSEGAFLEIVLDAGGDTIGLQVPLSPSVFDPDAPAVPPPATSDLGIKSQAFKVYSSPDGTSWIELERKFGFLTVARLGFQVSDNLSIIVDAVIEVGALQIGLIDAGAQVALTSGDFPVLPVIEGISITFSKRGVVIGGSLEYQGRDGDIDWQYSGSLEIELPGKIRLMGLGTYAKLTSGEPSLSIYAVLGVPIGGPLAPELFISGLSAGFGYNSNLVLPTPIQVPQFPLLNMATDQSVVTSSPSVWSGIEVMKSALQAVAGDYWGGVGLLFTSFDVVQGIVLVTIEAGKDLQFGLLGLATLAMPKDAGADTVAYAQLSVAAVVSPSDGVARVSAALTPPSYFLSKNMRLSGMFAAYLWWGGGHAGDFVVSLGGYSPSYNPPSWYPYVPRLNFTWKIPVVEISGQAYCALVPSTFMAGGQLKLSWDCAGVRAWVNAQADFLIEWQPLYYDIYVGISAGCSYNLLGHTYKAELGANLLIQGPPFSAVANISWWVISFSIAFGSSASASDPPRLDYDSFYTSSLPQPSAGQPDQVITTTSPTSGLTSQTTETPVRWLVGVNGFSFTTQTAIPALEICLSDGSGSALPPIAQDTSGTGIRPMGVGVASFSSQHLIQVQSLATGSPAYVDMSTGWDCTPTTNALPAALWSPNPADTEPDSNDQLLPDKLIGLVLQPTVVYGSYTQALLSVLTAAEQTGVAALPIVTEPPAYVASNPSFGDNTWPTVTRTVMAPATVATRTGILAAAEAWNAIRRIDVDLSKIQADPYIELPWAPRIGPLGSFTDQAPPAPLGPRQAAPAPPAGPGRAAPAAAVPVPSPTSPRLRAVVQQYRHAPAPGADAPARIREACRVTSLVHSMDGVSGRQVTMRRGLRIGEPEDGVVGMTLNPGAGVIWEAMRGETLRGIRGSGSLAVRAVSFNRHHELLEDSVVTGDHELPEGTTQLVLIGMSSPEPAEGGRARGWTSGSRLLLANPVSLIAEGAVIRPQGPMRIRNRGRRLSHGVTSGARMSRVNVVQGLDGLQPAALTHYFSGTGRTVTVLLRTGGPEPAGDGRGPESTIVVAGPMRSTERTRLELIDAVVGGRDARLVYATTSPAPAKVGVRPPPGWQLSGVLVFSDEASHVAAGWSGYSIDCSHAGRADGSMAELQVLY